MGSRFCIMKQLKTKHPTRPELRVPCLLQGNYSRKAGRQPVSGPVFKKSKTLIPFSNPKSPQQRICNQIRRMP